VSGLPMLAGGSRPRRPSLPYQTQRSFQRRGSTLRPGEQVAAHGPTTVLANCVALAASRAPIQRTTGNPFRRPTFDGMPALRHKLPTTAPDEPFLTGYDMAPSCYVSAVCSTPTRKVATGRRVVPIVLELDVAKDPKRAKRSWGEPSPRGANG